MSRSLRRGAIAALVLAAVVPLSACAAGNQAETLQIKPDNAATSVGQNLRLNNVLLVTAKGASSDEAGPVNLTVNIANTGSAPEVLQSVSVEGAGTATFTDGKGADVSEIVIPAGGSVLIGGEGQPAAHLASAKLPLGGYADTDFTFKTAGKVGLPVGVVPATGLYASFGPKAPEATAKPSASASASASPSATATGSPSASASGSATAGATATGSATATASASAH
ncbi:DUF461 domain-containing protein [Kitasatospora sp. DSM 101779]|uniref:DUF461 domain-containing protein n=1 Tax=Kitasatospora sp. DSM 101779 TaxID=2853165 RepID=UPI0021D853B1|nr:DUF461 domain-containing protein [Kitasatospora sp. DSM 101779]MCU7824064.1 DUF461 domain-containing protein [Kitasatospora sp. DSM 101779]